MSSETPGGNPLQRPPNFVYLMIGFGTAFIIIAALLNIISNDNANSAGGVSQVLSPVAASDLTLMWQQFEENSRDAESQLATLQAQVVPGARATLEAVESQFTAIAQEQSDQINVLETQIANAEIQGNQVNETVVAIDTNVNEIATQYVQQQSTIESLVDANSTIIAQQQATIDARATQDTLTCYVSGLYAVPVRKEPNDSAERVTLLTPDSKGRATGHNGGVINSDRWWFIEINQNDLVIKGWVWSGAVREEDERTCFNNVELLEGFVTQ